MILRAAPSRAAPRGARSQHRSTWRLRAVVGGENRGSNGGRGRGRRAFGASGVVGGLRPIRWAGFAQVREPAFGAGSWTGFAQYRERSCPESGRTRPWSRWSEARSLAGCVVETEPLQTLVQGNDGCLAGLQRLSPCSVAGPQLGGDEQVAARQSRALQCASNPFTDSCLVPVKLGGVDVAVAGLDGGVDGDGRFAVRDEIGPEAEVGQVHAPAQRLYARAMPTRHRLVCRAHALVGSPPDCWRTCCFRNGKAGCSPLLRRNTLLHPTPLSIRRPDLIRAFSTAC